MREAARGEAARDLLGQSTALGRGTAAPRPARNTAAWGGAQGLRPLPRRTGPGGHCRGAQDRGATPRRTGPEPLPRRTGPRATAAAHGIGEPLPRWADARRRSAAEARDYGETNTTSGRGGTRGPMRQEEARGRARRRA